MHVGLCVPECQCSVLLKVKEQSFSEFIETLHSESKTLLFILELWINKNYCGTCCLSLGHPINMHPESLATLG